MVISTKAGLLFSFFHFPDKCIILKGGEFILGNYIHPNEKFKKWDPLWSSGRQKHKNLLRECRIEKAYLLMFLHWPIGKSAINCLPLPVIGAIKNITARLSLHICLRHNQSENVIRYSNFLSTQQSEYLSTYTDLQFKLLWLIFFAILFLPNWVRKLAEILGQNLKVPFKLLNASQQFWSLKQLNSV